ncbi:MAG TPA: prephenate dehydrogenase [Vicinamibacterales bacterium]|nr:prephenate dehydrogenase [Vicinamibacterales bacterium]
MLPVIQPDPGPPPFERIAIVGFGLVGGSIALAVRQGWRGGLIIAIDRKDVLEAAMRVHAADVAGDDLVMASGADLIILAAPVRQNIALLGRLAEYVPGPALVTDVGSTKADMVEAAAGLPERLRFIGGHPLAGAAAGGFDAARPDLFRGRPWILTPDRPDDDGQWAVGDGPSAMGSLERLERFVTALGATPVTMGADEHDRLLAWLSHLPQLTASALMHVVGERAGAAGLALAGRGLRDTTRLASSPAGIWQDIAATNTEQLSAALGDLVDALERLRADLSEGSELKRIFESAARWKANLESAGFKDTG